MSAAPETLINKFGVIDRQMKFGKIEFDDIRGWEEPIERECFVEHLFPKGELVAIYGNPKDGKSHVATYLLYRASLGLGSFGLDAIPCRVVYLALEGGNGFRNRVLALKRRFGESANFFPMRRPLNFLDDEQGVRDLVAGLRAFKADIIVIDTVTRALPGGDQNGQEAFSKLVGIVDGIRNETGVCAVLVHHAGVSGRMMGSTVLPGALDVLLRVTHDEETGIRTLKIEDARDDEAGLEVKYRIEGFELAVDAKGKPIKTGIVIECEDQTPTVTQAAKPMSKNDAAALIWLRQAIDEYGEMSPFGVPPGMRAVTFDNWKAMARKRSDTPDNARKAVERACPRLQATRIIAANAPYVWVLK